MPSPIDLANAGGFAAFVALTFAILEGFRRKWIVPGWLYEQERQDRQKADVQADRNTESIERLTRAVDRLIADVRADRKRNAPR